MNVKLETNFRLNSTISAFPSQTTILAVYRSPNCISSDNLLVLQAIRHDATAPGECLIVGDFNALAVDWSNRTCPKSDGIDKNLLTTAEEEFLYQSITKPTRFQLGNRPSVFDIVFTKFPNTVSAIKLLAPLGNSDRALLFFTFGLHDSHEPPRPRDKFC